jgi:outer membrane protein OmpA-like peptidoglycan-associated protein
MFCSERFAMTSFVTTGQLANRRRYSRLAAGAFTALLLTGCRLDTGPQSTPAVPKQPSCLKAAPEWVTERTTQVAPDLYFNLNAHTLARPARRQLLHIAVELEGILHDFPDLIIVIEGHGDDRGVPEYNEQLGLERADAVKSALLNAGLPEDRLRTASFSHHAPLCVTPDDRCRQKNRRVHFRAAQSMSMARGGVSAR